MAQSVFLCLTRPVFSQEMDIFSVLCEKQINQTLPLSRLLQGYKCCRQNVHTFLLKFLTFRRHSCVP